MEILSGCGDGVNPGVLVIDGTCPKRNLAAVGRPSGAFDAAFEPCDLAQVGTILPAHPKLGGATAGGTKDNVPAVRRVFRFGIFAGCGNPLFGRRSRSRGGVAPNVPVHIRIRICKLRALAIAGEEAERGVANLDLIP